MFESVKRDHLKLFFIFLMATSIIAISQSVVTIALVQIIDDFSISSTMAQRSFSIFLLTLGVVIPLNPFISRRFKVRTIYSFAVGCFLVGSVICYFSFDIVSLVIGRILQAASFAIMMQNTQIILLKVVPEDDWQMFMGIYGFFTAFIPVLGLILGGYIIDVYGWKNVFALFAVLSVILFAVGMLFVKIDLGTEEYPLDKLSVVLSFVGCFGVMFGFINIKQYSLMSLYVILPIIIGAVSLIVFFKRQRSLEKPLLKMDMLQNRYYAVGFLVLIIGFFMFNGCDALIPIFVEEIAGYNAEITSLIVFSGGFAAVIFNFVGAYLANEYGAKKPILAGGFVLLIAHILMMSFSSSSPVEFLAATQFIRYIGFGLLFIPISTWAISMVPECSEDGSTVYNASREIAGSIGSAMLVVIASFFAGGDVGHNAQSVAAFSHTSLLLVALTVVIIVISIFFVKEKRDVA
jgi:predicted MFS family arabinose efflux permease